MNRLILTSPNIFDLRGRQPSLPDDPSLHSTFQRIERRIRIIGKIEEDHFFYSLSSHRTRALPSSARQRRNKYLRRIEGRRACTGTEIVDQNKLSIHLMECCEL